MMNIKTVDKIRDLLRGKVDERLFLEIMGIVENEIDPKYGTHDNAGFTPYTKFTKATTGDSAMAFDHNATPASRGAAQLNRALRHTAPVLGDRALAFDSAEGIYRGALQALGKTPPRNASLDDLRFAYEIATTAGRTPAQTQGAALARDAGFSHPKLAALLNAIPVSE
jgi:hypothetical protein